MDEELPAKVDPGVGDTRDARPRAEEERVALAKLREALIEFDGCPLVRLLVGVALPVQGLVPWAGLVVALAGMLALAVLVGVVETVMARLKLVRVPQLLVGATALAVLAMVLVMRG